MRIEQEYKKTGYFWLPEEPDKKIPGTLTISDGGKIELEIIGSFDERPKPFDAVNEIDRIIGNVERDGFVTLERCFYTYEPIFVSGISKSFLHVDCVLSGVAYDKDEQVTFNTLSFSVDCIDQWVGISGIGVETDLESKTATISYKHPGNLSYSLANGMRLEICFGCTFPGFPNITEAKITQNAYFRLCAEEPRPLKDFSEIAWKITQLLCFAIDTTVSLKGLRATSNEIQRTIGNSKPYPVPINVYYESIPFSEKEPKIDHHKMVFTFGIIKDNAGDVFNKWIDAYDLLAPALGLYFSTKTGAQEYLDGKFLALAQGIETYHRRTSDEKLMDDLEFEELVKSIMKHCPEERSKWLNGRLKYGNEISLRKRIKRMVEPFKEYFGNQSDIDRMIGRIVDTRNYLTHYDESLNPKAAQGRGLWLLYSKMEAIYQLHFLKVIGFADDEVSSVVENCYTLKRKLGALP